MHVLPTSIYVRQSYFHKKDVPNLFRLRLKVIFNLVSRVTSHASLGDVCSCTVLPKKIVDDVVTLPNSDSQELMKLSKILIILSKCRLVKREPGTNFDKKHGEPIDGSGPRPNINWPWTSEYSINSKVTQGYSCNAILPIYISAKGSRVRLNKPRYVKLFPSICGPSTEPKQNRGLHPRLKLTE